MNFHYSFYFANIIDNKFAGRVGLEPTSGV